MKGYIPAITLWQPWASLIAKGYKTIETRTHGRFKRLRGRRIAIHAGKKIDIVAWNRLEHKWPTPGGRPINDVRVMEFLRERRVVRETAAGCCGRKPQVRYHVPVGRILCTIEVQDAGGLSPDDEDQALCPTKGLFGLFLDPTTLNVFNPSIPAKGHQGVWYWRPPENAR